MRKIILIAGAALATLSFTMVVPADAKGPGGGGWKGGGGYPHGFSQGHKVGWGSASRPPGWSKGNKTGWHGSRTPPGWTAQRYR